MNILLLTTGLNKGGAERQVLELTNAFRKFDQKCLIFNLGSNNHYQGYNEYGVINLNVKAFRLVRINKLLKILRVYRKYNSHVIHSHMFHANIAARIIRTFDRTVKIVNTAHSHIEGSIYRYIIYYFTSKLCHYFSTVSLYSQRQLFSRDLFPIKADVVYNGIKVEDFSITYKTQPNKPIKIGIFGRLAREKNIDVVLHTYSTSNFLRSATTLKIVGSGEDKILLERLINKFNLHETVSLEPATTLDSSIYDTVDILLIPSSYESFSLVAVEAILARKPVLITKNTGISNDFPDLVSVIDVSKSGDLERQIKLLIEAYNKDQQSIYDVLDSRYEKCKQFDINKIALQWLSIYQ
jgi:glycosyltransferase involved in cell wall biosynthesis